jgi:ABC-type phosphate/phosphonate transport system substrate-binding protein
MIGPKRVIPGLAALAVGLAVLAARAPGQQAQSPPGAVKIGMVSSLFRDLPPSLIQVLTPPFQSLMREQTGLEGELVTVGDSQDLAKRLNDKQVQLGVFHGFEFAWAQQKHPELKPLVIAINRHRTLRAFVVVREDSTAAGLADLKGKTLSQPRRSREHCLLFLDHECRALGAEPKEFFGKVVNHNSTEDALDDVLRDVVQAALVDSVALESYQQIKSGCFARLKILKQSEVFPAAVVAYRNGVLDEATLGKFRDGMISANQSVRGRELMAMWKLTAFEKMPADFQKTLDNILKAYPAPEGPAVQSRPK